MGKTERARSSLSHAPRVTRNARKPELPVDSLKRNHAPRVMRNAKPKENLLSHAPRVTRNAKPPEVNSLKMDQLLLRRMPRRRSSLSQPLRRKPPPPRNPDSLLMDQLPLMPTRKTERARSSPSHALRETRS